MLQTAPQNNSNDQAFLNLSVQSNTIQTLDTNIKELVTTINGLEVSEESTCDSKLTNLRLNIAVSDPDNIEGLIALGKQLEGYLDSEQFNKDDLLEAQSIVEILEQFVITSAQTLQDYTNLSVGPGETAKGIIEGSRHSIDLRLN